MDITPEKINYLLSGIFVIVIIIAIFVIYEGITKKSMFSGSGPTIFEQDNTQGPYYNVLALEPVYNKITPKTST